jgi:hypothetical protein
VANDQLTIEEAQFFWVAGAIERLASLGVFSPNVPFTVSPDKVEEFQRIDENINNIFRSDAEVISVFYLIMKNEYKTLPPIDMFERMCLFLMEYKNNRDKLYRNFLNV